MKAVKQVKPILPPKHSWEKVPETFDEYTCSKCSLYIKKHPVLGWLWQKKVKSSIRTHFNELHIIYVSWRESPPLPCNAAVMNEALE